MRPVSGPEDLRSLDELFAACALADGHAALGEHKYLSLQQGDTATISLIEEQGSTIVAYLHLSESGGTWTFEAAVHPGYRNENLLRALAKRAMQEAAERGGFVLRTWIFNATWPEPLAELGFIQERELRQLRAGLPLPPPVYPGEVESAVFRPGVDETRLLEVNNAAFAGHPENGNWTSAHLELRMAQDWWDPHGVRMAWEGDRLVGFCWTKEHPGALGEIYVIAVIPERRRRGLGRALTLDGLAHLADTGSATGMLYVDASNAAALGMYQNLGFRLHHIDRSLMVPLR